MEFLSHFVTCIIVIEQNCKQGDCQGLPIHTLQRASSFEWCGQQSNDFLLPFEYGLWAYSKNRCAVEWLISCLCAVGVYVIPGNQSAYCEALRGLFWAWSLFIAQTREGEWQQ